MNSYFPKDMKTKYSAVRDRYKKIGREPADDGMTDTDVTFDGTGMRRGHIGTGFVLETDTRLIIDFEVLCNMCSPCNIKKTTHTHKEEQRKATRKARKKGIRVKVLLTRPGLTECGVSFFVTHPFFSFFSSSQFFSNFIILHLFSSVHIYVADIFVYPNCKVLV